MLVLTALLAATATVTAGVVRALLLRAPEAGLLRPNFRGAQIPVIGGVVLAAALIASESMFALLALLPTGDSSGGLAFSPKVTATAFFSEDHRGVAVLALAFCLLGAFDDLAGAGSAKGLGGHLARLRKGELTSGGVKAVGGLGAAFAVSAVWELELIPTLVDTMLIALTANLINLLDLRPGRAGKVFLAGWIPIAALSWTTPYLPASAAIAFAVLVWLPSDLGEQAMLGDAGANLIGGVLGAGAALSLGPVGKSVWLAAVTVLTLLSERVSFTQLIDATPPLRWLDRLGRAAE